MDFVKKELLNMKKKRKVIITIIVLITLIGTTSLYVANGVNVANGADTDTGIRSTNGSNQILSTSSLNTGDTVKKDETVYVNLNTDGAVSKMNVVNYFVVDGAGIYQDYGNYNSVINLTNEIAPLINEDSIQWELKETTEDFYYQGELNQGELPWTFDIQYSLNGTKVNAEELSNAEGELVLEINVTENQSAEEYFRENYMMQITIPFNMENTTLLSSPGAVEMIAGHTKTLAYTVLPETSITIEIQAQIHDFSMDSMDITMMKADLGAYMDTEDMAQGFTDMSEGMGELKNGTVQLKEGLTDLSSGIDQISDGLNEVSEGTPKLLSGMDQFGDGLGTFKGNLNQLATGSNDMEEGLQGLADNGGQLVSGYQEIENGMSSLLTMKDEMMALGSLMAQSSDPQTVQLAQAMMGQLEGIMGLQEGLNTLNSNLNGYMQGVEEVAGQYGTLNNGINALPEGFEQLAGGYDEIKNGNKKVFSALDEMSKGLSEIADGADEIPDRTQELIDGQQQIMDGLNEAVSAIEELTGSDTKAEEIIPVSFAAPGKVIPNSVQFILRTPSIDKAEKQLDRVETEEDAPGFWDKLLDLFR